MNELKVLNNNCGGGEDCEGGCCGAAVAAAKERSLWRQSAAERTYW